MWLGTNNVGNRSIVFVRVVKDKRCREHGCCLDCLYALTLYIYLLYLMINYYLTSYFNIFKKLHKAHMRKKAYGIIS